MRDVMMIGIVVAFAGLLLLVRSLLFRRRGGNPYRVYLMNRGDRDDHPRESDSSDEWPSIIGAEEDSGLDRTSLSEAKRIELAVMQDRIIRMLP
jgi:hypothetical protein